MDTNKKKNTKIDNNNKNTDTKCNNNNDQSSTIINNTCDKPKRTTMSKREKIKNRRKAIMESTYPIGIDLGTTNSCIAIWKNNVKNTDKVVIVPNTLGQFTVPSYVRFENGYPYVGHDAKDNARLYPKNTFYGIKRLIGKR